MLILQHGQDMREHPPSESQFPARPLMQVSVPRVQPRDWFPVEDEMSPRQLNRVAPPMEFPLNSESLSIDNHQAHPPPFLHKVENFIPPGRVLVESQSLPKETLPREDMLRLNQSLPDFHSFSDKYLSQIKPDSSYMPGDRSRFAILKDNEFIGDVSSCGCQSLPKEEVVHFLTASAPTRILDPRIEASKKSMGSISALKNLCVMEGLGVAFQTQPQVSVNPGLKIKVYAQVEINGQVLGKGIGLTWDDAKSQAAEKALVALKSMLGEFPFRHQGSPSSMQGMSNKRLKPDISRVLPRMPSSTRYPKNASPMP